MHIQRSFIYIYFKLKIKDRHASIYLANGFSLVEFRIWEKKEIGIGKSL